MKRVAFYIDSHGFGHSTRSISLASSLPSDWELVLRTNGPEWLFREELPREFELVSSPLDIHPMQSEGYKVDADWTRRHLLEKMEQVDGLIEEEKIWLRENRIDRVLSDISPLAIESAHLAGIPCYGISNFTWHWTFETMLSDPECQTAIRSLEEMIGHASTNFRLPFSVPEVFPGESVETPLVTRTPRKPRREVRRDLGMDPDGEYVLVTFGGFDNPDRDLRVLEDLSPIQFIRVLSLAERQNHGTNRSFERDRKLKNLWHYVHPTLYHPDLVGAVDAVVTKPGYGILSETMPLGVPLLLDTREDFREFHVVKDTLSDYPQVQFISSDRMERLDFAEELRTVLAGEKVPWRGPTHGAEFIVNRIQ